MRVLVVEDEAKLAHFLKKGLTEQGYAVDLAENGLTAEQYSADHEYDLVILDIRLPDKDGLSVANYLRANEYKGPILMLTAMSTTKDKVQGLDAGADDYMTKPFSMDELLARVRALLRRQGLTSSESNLRIEDLQLDLVKRKVKRGESEILMTNKELALLEYFMRNKGRPLSRAEIIEHVWDMGFDPGSNIVDVYVNMLRKKIDADFDKKLIHTVIGQGYAMEVRA